MFYKINKGLRMNRMNVVSLIGLFIFSVSSMNIFGMNTTQTGIIINNTSRKVLIEIHRSEERLGAYPLSSATAELHAHRCMELGVLVKAICIKTENWHSDI